LRGHAIGRDHELLDQLLGCIGFIGAKIAQYPGAKYRLRFNRLQVQRSARAAHVAQRLRHLVLQPQTADSIPGTADTAAGAGASPCSHAPTAL